MKNIQSYAFWGLYSLGSLLLSIWLAWQLSAQVNFLYPIWYSALKIDQTIEQTVPRHLYKKEFIVTEESEHHRLFAKIVTAIQNRGEGLANINFYSPSGQLLGKLLTDSEVVHLQDVAALIDLLGWFSGAILIFCLVILGAIFFFRVAMPTTKKLLIAIFALVGACVVIISLGAKELFYWLNTVVFPDNHQWFFYYEESLMSTLMKAPVLFAPITILILLLGLLIWVLHLLLLRKLGQFKMV